jgi:hypothetical protein
MKNPFKREYETEYNRWVSFYPKFNTSLYVEKAGYFDERPQVHTSVTQLIIMLLTPILLFYSLWFLLLIPFMFIGWGALYIYLPIKTGIQDCESAAWGFNYHNDTIWIYIGGGGNFEGGKKWITIDMPWQIDWYRTSTLLYGSTWFHETKNNRKTWNGSNIRTYDWLEENKWKETHPYIDNYDGTQVNATISVEEREWRPKWFKWTNLFAKVRKTIRVDFDKEVGSEKGSWKGGVLGCGYELLPGETPQQCLKRMEIERKF